MNAEKLSELTEGKLKTQGKVEKANKMNKKINNLWL